MKLHEQTNKQKSNPNKKKKFWGCKNHKLTVQILEHPKTTSNLKKTIKIKILFRELDSNKQRAKEVNDKKIETLNEKKKISKKINNNNKN